MRCLTLCQPYAWLVIHGPKRIENRSRPLSYTGPLLIHAGKSMAWWKEIYPACAAWEFIPSPDRYRREYKYGKIIGQVQMIGCRDLDDMRFCGPIDQRIWMSGPWCYEFADPIAFADPLAYRGSQGIFHVPDELVEKYLAS